MSDEAFQLLKEREESLDGINSEKEWSNYQQDLKSRFFKTMTRFEKTPLNAKTTGILEREDFFVEKVVFESQPGFYVTAALYIPKNLKKPAPAILYCCGHTAIGFKTDIYQYVPINLAKKGFVVLAFDPISQGERLQYLDPETGKSRIGGATTEHTYAGVQCLITGMSLSEYFIWDGVRAIDYLATREEVDMSRIGITGRSGGGLQSALIGAYDERVLAAAPECYLTSFKRLYQSIGPQDAEQNPYAAIKKGFDHVDYLHIRAPKPTLMITTTHDFFSQQGARETYAKGLKSFTAFGKPGNLQMVEDLGKHESTLANREAMYAFFQKFLELPGDSHDIVIEPFTEQELQVTPTGQVGSSYKSETVFSLNQKYFTNHKLADKHLVEKVKELSGIELSRNFDAAVYTGNFHIYNYEVEKYFLESDRQDFILPVYVAGRQKAEPGKILVWLHPEGKQEVLNEPRFKSFLEAGYTIVSCDLLGTGELRDSAYRGDGNVRGTPFNFYFGSQLAGNSISGFQAESFDLLIQFLKEKFGAPEGSYQAYIQEESAFAFLQYAAFKNPFSKIVFSNPLESVRSLINTEYYKPALAYEVVPGSLAWYDMKDLYSILPKGSYLISGKVDGSGVSIQAEMDFPKIIEFLEK